MNIGIDLRPLSPGASGGIAPHVKGVVDALIRTYPQDHYHIFCTIFSRALLDSVADNVTVHTFAGFNFYQQLGAVAKEHRIDALFRSFPVSEGLDFPLHRQAFLIPDMQHEAWPDFFDPQVLRRRRAAFNDAVSGAGALGTSCEFARKTIQDHPWTGCRDIFLMPPALVSDHVRIEAEQLRPEERAALPGTRYFYFPANLWPHKNHRRLLKAFDQLIRGGQTNITLLLSGHPTGWAALQQEFSHLPVRHLGFVRSEFVRYLLQNAAALCFFSLYEGFGMPVLEAFDAGCPVLCSNTTSLPEVAGDAALTCDPTDIGAMAQRMGRILDEPQLRGELVRAGRSRAGLWSWEQSARQLHEALERIAGQPERPSITINEPTVVSIVTPSYNQGQFLRRTIESVLSQDYPHIDYCVMDGGSTDESVEILKSYGDRFPWVSEKDRGQTHAINKGLERSRGQLRAYLNSDDVLRPGAVRAAVDHFERQPELDMIYGKAEYIDENDGFLEMYRTAPYSFAHLVNECMVCQPATFWTTRIARLIGPFDESLHYAMDYDYWLRIGRAGGIIAHVDDILACSRLYAATKTLSMREKVFAEVLAVTRKHAGWAPLSYFCGLWHHRAVERRDTLISRFPRLPILWRQAAMWHCMAYNQGLRSSRDMIRAVGASARSWLWTRRPVQAVASRVGALAVISERHKTVRGIYSDNWMGPHAILTIRHQVHGATLRLCGISPVDGTVTIRAGKRVLAERTVAGGKENDLSFVFPGGARRVDLRFSRHIVDSVGRKLAFLIQETNCFGEADMG